MKPTDTVLLYGLHSLFYVNFPFIDSSWIKKGDTFTHVAIQWGEAPERFKDWNLVYNNTISGVKLYTKEAKQWIY